MSVMDPPAVMAVDTPELMASEPSGLMTLEQLLLLPDDRERDLIDGRLVERPMTRRNRWHARAESLLVFELERWLKTRPAPQGQILSGEAGFRLRRDPDTSFGIDVAYVSAEVIAATPATSPYIEGPPVLAVEILSPSTVHGDMVTKIRAYLDLGVRVVWVVDPDFRTVVVYRPGVAPEMFNTTHELTGGDDLPGFRADVASIFA